MIRVSPLKAVISWYSENLADEIGRVILETEFCDPEKTEIKINSPAAF